MSPELSSETLATEIDLLLDQVFVSRAAVAPEDYIVSAISQLRRTLDRRTGSLMPAAHYDLPPWILGEPRFGPYETRLLETLLSAPGPVVAFRGGTGSGKSSALGFVQAHVKESAIFLGNTDPLPLGYSGFLLTIDLNQVLPSAHLDGSSGLAATIAADDIFSFISRAVAASLAEDLSAAHLADILLKTLTTPDAQSVRGIRHIVLDTLRLKIGASLVAATDRPPEERVKLVRDAMSSLPPNEQLVAWLCVLRRLELDVNSGTPVTRWPLMLILDNLDPLNASAQNALLQEIVRITAGAGWGRLKIVLGMRVSTFAQFCGSHGFNFYEHEGPDPVELLFVRLTLALLTFDSIPQVSRATSLLRRSLYARLVSLFYNITDRNGYFADILAALSGSNIRNCFHYAHRWCMSQKLAASGENSAWRNQGFEAQLKVEVSRHLLGNLARGISRTFLAEARALLDEWSVDELVSRYGAGSAAVRLLSGMDTATHAANIFGTFHTDDRSPRALLAEHIGTALLKQLENEGRYWRGIDAGQQTRPPSPPPGYATLILCQAFRYCVEDGLARGIPKAFIDEVYDQMIRLLTSSGDGRRTPDPERYLKEWIGAALHAVHSTDIDTTEWRRRRRFETVQVNLQRPTGDLNRYQAETILLSADGGDGPAPPNALNVFSANKQTVSAIGLRILCYLDENLDGHVTRSELLNFLTKHGYAESDIETTLESMVHIRARLIFSGVHDQYLGRNAWLSDGAARVYLSNAGASYVRTLIIMPSYLQWALGDILSLRAEVERRLGRAASSMQTVRHRLSFAQIGLELAWRDEMRRLEESWKGTPPEVPRQEFLRCSELRRQSAAADVFFRSLEGFVQVYRVNVIAGRRAPEVTEDFKLDATQWLNLGKTMIEQHERLFGAIPDAWRRSLGRADSEVQRMVRV